jgi:phosphate transport system permease protein
MNAKIQEKIASRVLFFCTVMVVLPVVMILAIILYKGIGAISWEFLFSMPKNGMRAGGILPAILGTLYLVAGAVLFALPLGVLTAIYLVEYSRDNFLSRLIKLAIVNLAGVPSVVYGLFGLGIFVTFFQFGASILAGSLTLGIMILPVIITASREALIVPGGQPVPGGQQMADHSSFCFAPCAARDSYRRHPGDWPGLRGNRAHPIHRGGFLSA